MQQYTSPSRISIIGWTVTILAAIAAFIFIAKLRGKHHEQPREQLPVLAQVNSGTLKALAVAATTRAPQLPNVPTMAEKGLPGVTMETTYGIVAPKALPPAIANRMRDAIVAAVQAPEMKQQFLQQGALPVTSTGPEYQRLMQAESDKWKNIIAKAKITLE